MFYKKLYVRIWLAVVLAVAVLTLLVGWAWRLAAEPPLREVVMRSEGGQDEVAFLAKRFNIAAERIETPVHSQEALLASQKSLRANASHELRSPLTRIRMGIELLGASASATFKAEIERNITELDQLIEEILLASRFDARDADLGTVEAVDLLGLAAEECAHVDAELEVQLAPDATPPLDDSGPGESALPVQGVAKLLRRAVRN